MNTLNCATLMIMNRASQWFESGSAIVSVKNEQLINQNGFCWFVYVCKFIVIYSFDAMIFSIIWPFEILLTPNWKIGKILPYRRQLFWVNDATQHHVAWLILLTKLNNLTRRQRIVLRWMGSKFINTFMNFF